MENLQQRFDKQLTDAERKIDQFKGSLQFFKALTRYAQHLGKGGMRFRNIMFKEKPFASREKIKEIYYSFNDTYSLSNRIDGTRETLIRMLNQKVGSELRTKWVEEAVQNLSQEEIHELFKNKPREFKDNDEEFKFLARQIVVKELKPVRNAIMRNRFLSINAQYVHMLRTLPKWYKLEKIGVTEAQWQAHVEKLVENLKNRQLTMVDTSAYLYLYDLITGKRGDRSMRYVFIDEIQDYNAFQLAYLRYKSYRSTQPITDFTKEILEEGEAIEAFNRQGELPRVAVTQDQATMLKTVQAQLERDRQDHETTAIIGRSLAECEQITEQLQAAGEKVTLIRTENQRLVEGTLVVPSFLAKGLEFDSVIVWDANAENYQSHRDEQLLYTICSRAMHRLLVVAKGQLSPLIAKIPESLYQTIN